MILLVLVLVLLAGGLLAWAAGARRPRWARWISLLALAADLGLTLVVLAGPAGNSQWRATLDRPWIPALGVRLHLGADGLALALLVLTFVLGLVAVVASWDEIHDRVGFFHFNLLAALAGIAGVFVALDLFLFYVLWELMLIPMYFLILLWGSERRRYAALKFFLFTQGGSLVMLVAIVVLALLHREATGRPSFDYFELLRLRLPPGWALPLMLGFFVAFAVKLPVVPLHTWLPDAHAEAPTAGSIVLAGLLLKTGAYGLLRFVLPLFPEAVPTLAPVARALGATGVLYGALLAFGQSDVKRLVAYTSVSHLGFVLLGAFSGTALGREGAVLEMICHGLGTGALFFLAGMLSHRLHTRELGRMGGLWDAAPRAGALTLFFALAALGLPGLGTFVAEILVLGGAFARSPVPAAFAALGLVGATLYALALFHRTFLGRPREAPPAVQDANPRELGALLALGAGLLWLGVYPQPALETVRPALEARPASAGPLTQEGHP